MQLGNGGAISADDVVANHSGCHTTTRCRRLHGNGAVVAGEQSLHPDQKRCTVADYDSADRLHNDRYRRDAQGRVVELTTTFPDYTNLIVNTYNTLGALVGVRNSRANGWATVERFDVDAFGHQVRSESISNTGDHRVDRYAYQSGTERATTLTGDTATAPGRTPTLNFHKTTYTPSGGWSGR